MICRTIGQVVPPSVSLVEVVDTAVRRVVLGLKVPPIEEVLAYPLILKVKVRTVVREDGEG